MHRIIGLFAGVGIVSLAAWFALANARATTGTAKTVTVSDAEPTGEDRGLLPSVYDKPALTGVNACGTSSCHGAKVDPRLGHECVKRGEMQFWSKNDPHTRIHDVLDGDLGKQILENLDIDRNSTEFQNCVSCHSFNTLPGTRPDLAGHDHGSGTFNSCQFCHGPAKNWQAEHYQWGWADKSHKDIVERGMVSKQDHIGRARVCAECHVGSRDREVNHDLVAAGHPPLRFEYTAYLDMLPPHWDEAAERAEHSDYDLKKWLAGQIASADAALDLLTARAERSSPQHVWPEFSEYSCSSCHHDLLLDEKNRSRFRPEKTYKLAVPDWGDWYFGMLSQLAETEDEELHAKLSDLHESMNNFYAASPEQVAEKAKASQIALHKWASAHAKLDGETAIQLLTGSNGEETVNNWDRSAQFYLALAAVYQNGQSRDKTLHNEIGQLRSFLLYPDGYRTPRDFVGAVGEDNPRSEFLQKLRATLNQLEQQ